MRESQMKIVILFSCGKSTIESFLKTPEKKVSAKMRADSGLDLEVIKELIKTISGKNLKIKLTEPDLFRFIFSIPFSCDKSSKSNDNIPDEGSMLYPWPQIRLHSNPPTTVLVVDDMPINLDIAKKLITNINIDCLCFLSAEEVIHHLTEYNPCREKYKIIIMDCMMPNLDGWEATSMIISLYKDKKMKHLPYIIGHSAFQSPDDIKRCFSSGMDDFLPKPSSPREFYNKISKWMLQPIRETSEEVKL